MAINGSFMLAAAGIELFLVSILAYGLFIGFMMMAGARGKGGLLDRLAGGKNRNPKGTGPFGGRDKGTLAPDGDKEESDDFNAPDPSKGSYDLTIINRHTNKGIAGARIYYATEVKKRFRSSKWAEPKYLMTDAHGKITLNFVDGNYKIAAWANGYYSSEWIDLKFQQGSTKTDNIYLYQHFRVSAHIDKGADVSVLTVEITV